jgi:hypothetical protein
MAVTPSTDANLGSMVSDARDLPRQGGERLSWYAAGGPERSPVGQMLTRR